ncbi:VOC family protein [Rhodopseudomonas pseudopalustris]|uniref:VOC domain-containing protein n=1 Tax=Rhodopseudomonas pseudopalustris TaxID=1513892 RepID=A0A1H8NQC4_9BRAD|nr:VOC family protein [Rhodopseudomonas pseudopalustris]SEO31573.1 hypothetical protein SAMN05444123_102215 [Rhodopseudomonas pseudopalustris]
MIESLRPRLTVITLGVDDVKTSAAFYERLGFVRAPGGGDQVAFFDTGASALALYSWKLLAEDATQADQPRPAAFRGATLAWNCRTPEEVDAVLAFAVETGAQLLRAAGATHYGGYRGYFTDPDQHVWEVVTAPGVDVRDDGRVDLSS